MVWLWSLSLAFLMIFFCVGYLTPAAIHVYGDKYFPNLKPPEPSRAHQGLHVVLLLMAVGVLAWQSGAPELSPSLALILGALYGVFRCDHAYQIIPDRFHAVGLLGTMAFITTGAALNLWHIHHLVVPMFIGLSLPVSLYLMNLLYSKVRKRTGLGLGDIKLCIWLAPLLGAEIYTMLFAACILAILVQLPNLLRERNTRQTFAFGPYIVTSTLATLYFQV